MWRTLNQKSCDGSVDFSSGFIDVGTVSDEAAAWEVLVVRFVRRTETPRSVLRTYVEILSIPSSHHCPECHLLFQKFRISILFAGRTGPSSMSLIIPPSLRKNTNCTRGGRRREARTRTGIGTYDMQI